MSVTRWASENLPEPVLSVLRPFYRVYHNFPDNALGILDSLGLIGPDFIYTEDYYSKRKDDPWRSDAQRVGAAIKQYFRPNSVVDFGCAIGAYLEPFYDDGIDIKGIEGHSDAFDHAVVPVEYLEQFDLRNRYEPEREYDLVLCFELAEHLPGRYADNLVDTLTGAGDTVVMTAAPPGQGGTHHVNEQPREYWYGKFEARGFAYDSRAVEDLRDAIDVEQAVWIPNNLMVFVDGPSDSL